MNSTATLARTVPWLRSIGELKQLSPRCAHHTCSRRSPVWTGFFGRDDGIRSNTDWYCGPQCFESALTDDFVLLTSGGHAQRRAVTNHMPLGLILLARGAITHEQLRAALDLQKRTAHRIGDCLRQLAGISEQEITAAIAAQWGCPVFPSSSIHPGAPLLVPLQLMEHYKMVPVHCTGSGRNLFVGFSERVDYALLYAIEQMLHSPTEPCVISSSTYIESLERRRAREANADVVFDRPMPADEMARTLRSYAQHLSASEVRYAACTDYVWACVQGHRTVIHLLFRRTIPNARHQQGVRTSIIRAPRRTKASRGASR